MIEVIEYVHEYEDNENTYEYKDGKSTLVATDPVLVRIQHYAINTQDEEINRRTGAPNPWADKSWRIDGGDLVVYDVDDINGLIGLLEKVKARLEVSASAPVVGVSDE